jgi:hypothetical protein
MTRFSPLLLLTFCGCTSQLNVGGPCAPFGTGEEPCRQQVYFPTGVAIDPSADVLYVSSSNADLRYSGGTVAAIDLVRYECAVRYATAGAFVAGDPCLNLDPFALPLTDGTPFQANGVVQKFKLTDPDPTDAQGRTVVQVDAASCNHDLLDPRIVECDESRFVTSAVKIGNFAGSIRVQLRQGDFDRRLWLPVRGDPSITFINVKRKYDGMPAPSSPVHDKLPSVAHLDCPDAQNPNPARTLDDCNAQRVTVRDFHGSDGKPLPACTADTDCPTGVSCQNAQCKPIPLPPEPFGLYLDVGPKVNGAPAYERLAVTHLLGGEVTLINAAANSPASTSDITPSENIVLDVHGGLFNADSAGRRGGFALAPLHPGAPLSQPSYWFVTSRLNPAVAMFRVADVSSLILPAPGFTLNNGPYLLGDDVRDLAVQADGNRAFFIENHPPSLFTVDTRPIESSSTGFPTNQVVDIVDVCQGPSHLGLRQWTEAGGPDAPDRVITRLYVVCFQTGQVAVIDPDLAIITDTILVGRGPNDIAFNFGDGIQPATPLPRRAYVTNFTDSDVSVIDLERGSPTENRVISRIGLTSPPVIP